MSFVGTYCVGCWLVVSLTHLLFQKLAATPQYLTMTLSLVAVFTSSVVMTCHVTDYVVRYEVVYYCVKCVM